MKIKGREKVIDPKPIFIGRSEGSSIRHLFPSPEKAEEWQSQSPKERHITASTTQANLASLYREKPLSINIKKAKYYEIIDDTIPQWETE
jgi:hypothetical protein